MKKIIKIIILAVIILLSVFLVLGLFLISETRVSKNNSENKTAKTKVSKDNSENETAKTNVEPKWDIPEWVIGECNNGQESRVRRCEIDLYFKDVSEMSWQAYIQFRNYNNEILSKCPGDGDSCKPYEARCHWGNWNPCPGKVVFTDKKEYRKREKVKIVSDGLSAFCRTGVCSVLVFTKVVVIVQKKNYDGDWDTVVGFSAESINGKDEITYGELDVEWNQEIKTEEKYPVYADSGTYRVISEEVISKITEINGENIKESWNSAIGQKRVYFSDEFTIK